MRHITMILVAALALGMPQAAMADKRSDTLATGALLGVLIAGAIAKNKKQKDHRYEYATDQVFYPADMPDVVCYTRARQCYLEGHYSSWATREVFQ